MPISVNLGYFINIYMVLIGDVFLLSNIILKSHKILGFMLYVFTSVCF